MEINLAKIKYFSAISAKLFNFLRQNSIQNGNPLFSLKIIKLINRHMMAANHIYSSSSFFGIGKIELGDTIAIFEIVYLSSIVLLYFYTKEENIT